MYKIVWHYKSVVGNFRTSNQDYGSFKENQFGQKMAVICDGMGGHESGDVASQLATKLIIDYFTKQDLSNSTDEEINIWLRETISKVQKNLLSYSKKMNKYRDMGTTMVCALITDTKMYIANVGDSRMYKLHQKNIFQITVDQNIYNSTSTDEKHEITFNGVYNRNYNNATFWKILTSALGPVKTLKIDTYLIEEVPGLYVLTTDGIHDFVEENDIAEILGSNKSNDYKCQALIDRALDNLSTDNLTGLILDIR